MQPKNRKIPWAGLFLAAIFVVPPAYSQNSSPMPDPGARGPYAVGHTSFVLVDPSRNQGPPFNGRPIPVSVWYPVDPGSITGATPPAVYPLDPVYQKWPITKSTDWEPYGFDAAYEGAPPSADRPFPLVVFSPGWGARYTGYHFLAARLASHGFVVALTQHYRDGLFKWDPRDPLEIALLNRPRDVSFMLSGILERNLTAGDTLNGLIRPDAIAASGHSLGGYAAMVLAGGDDSACDMVAGAQPSACVPTAPDPRIKAIVPLDGSNQVLHFYELARINVPVLGMGEEWERVQDWQARLHAAVSGHPAYRADVHNTLHNSFITSCVGSRVAFAYGLISVTQLNATLASSVCTTAIPQLEALRLVAKYMVAFLKTNLGGETGFQQILTPGWALTMEQNIEFFETERTNAHAVTEDFPCCFMYFQNQPGSAYAYGVRDPDVIRPVEHLADDDL